MRTTAAEWPTHRARARRAHRNRLGAARRRSRARRRTVKAPKWWGYLT